MADNFKIALQASIDIQKSQNEINKQIKTLKTDEIKIGIELDTKSAQKAISELSKEAKSLMDQDTLISNNNINSSLSNNPIINGELTSKLKEVLGVFSSIKSDTDILSWLGNVTSYTMNLGNALNTVKADGFVASTENLTTALSGLNEKQMLSVLSSKSLSTALNGLSETEIANMLHKAGLSSATAKTTAETLTMSTAQNVAKGTTWSLSGALTGLSAVIKANPLGLLITVLTTAFSVFSMVSSNAKQKQEELKTTINNNATESKNLSDEIASLTKKFNDLSEKVKTNSNVKGDLLSTQTELLTKLGLEGESVEDLIKKYGSLSEAIKQATLGQLKTAQADLVNKVNSSGDTLYKTATKPSFDTIIPTFQLDNNSQKAIDKLYKLNLISDTEYKGGIIGSKVEDVDDVVSAYDRLIKLRETLVSQYSNKELHSNELFDALSEKINSLKSDVESYKSDVSNLNTSMARQQTLEALKGKESPTTQTEFDAFKDSLVESAVASGDFIGSQKQISASIDNYLSSQPEFAQFFDTVSDEAEEASTSFKSFSDALSNEEASKSIDSFQSLMGEIKDALAKADNLSSSDIIDFMQQFPEFDWKLYGVTGAAGVGDLTSALKALALEQYNLTTSTIGDSDALRELYQSTSNAGDSINSLSDSMESLATASGLIDSANSDVKELGSISAETLNDISSKYPELESLVAEYNAGIASTGDIIAALTKVYNQDAENFRQANNIKLEQSESFYKQVYEAIPDYLKNWASSYKIDLENFKSVAEAKAKIISKLSDAWNSIPDISKDSPADEQRSEQRVLRQTKVKRELDIYDSISNISADLQTSIHITTPTSSKGSSSKKSNDKTTVSKYSQEFDLAAEKIKVLQNEIDILNSKLKNTSSAEAQVNIYEKLIKKQSELASAYKNTSSVYQKQYSSALSKLSKSDQGKVKTGAYTIAQFSGTGSDSKDEKRYNAIKYAIEVRDKLSDTNSNIQNSTSQLKTYTAELADIPWNTATTKVDKINGAIDLLNEKLNNTTNYETKNKLLDKILSNEKKVVDTYASATKDTENNIDSLYQKISKKNRIDSKGKAVKSGTRIATGGINDSSQLAYIIQYNKQITELNENTATLSLEQEKYKGYVADTKSQKFQNLVAISDELLKKYSALDTEIQLSSSLLEDNSTEQILVFQTGVTNSQNSMTAIKGEISKLNKLYAKGSVGVNDYKDRLSELKGRLNDAATSMKSYQDNILNSIKTRYDKEMESSKDALDQELKNIEKRRKTEEEAINKQINKFKEYIDERKIALQDDYDADKYQEELDEYSKSITKLESRIALLKRAELSGDRSASAERAELEEELSKQKKELSDKQNEHNLDTSLDALDDEYDAYEKMKNNQIDDINEMYDSETEKAQQLYDFKSAQIKELYEDEKQLIVEAAKLTSDDFSKAFSEINSTLSSFGLSASTGLKNSLKTTTKENTKTAENATSSNSSEIKAFLKSGTGTTSNSELNKYIKENYGSTLTFGQMVELAAMLRVNGINQIKDVSESSSNRMKILSALKAAKFATGGTVDASRNNTVSTLFGEDGIAFVKHKEEILTPEKANLLRGLLDVATPLKNLSQIATNNLSSVITNNNSSPNIIFNLNGGSITKEVIPQFDRWKDDITKMVTTTLENQIRKK